MTQVWPNLIETIFKVKLEFDYNIRQIFLITTQDL